MATTFLQPGRYLEYANSTGSTIANNTVLFMGSLPGVVQADIVDGDSGSVEIGGVHRLKKKTGTAFAIGDKLFWHATDGLTKTITDAAIGFAFAAAASGATVADVKLLDVAAAVQAVSFDQAAVVAAITDNGGGATANGTIEAITAATAAVTDTMAASLTSTNASIDLIKNAIKELTTNQAAILVSLKNAGQMASS